MTENHRLIRFRLPVGRVLQRYGMVLAVAAVYAAVFSALSIARHLAFYTQTWDLGIFEQSFWNTLHGRVMFNTFENVNHLSVHFSPFLFLLLPFYAIAPGPEMLLVLQSVALGSAVIPLYLLATRWLNRATAWVIVAAYLFYPPLHWLNLFDFHEVAFAIPAFLWAFALLDRGHAIGAAIALALAAGTAENMVLAVAGAGAYFILTQPSHRRFGVMVLGSSLIYFLLVAKIFMPALGGKIYRLDRYANLGATPPAIARTVLTQPALVWETVTRPAKLRYLGRLFSPLAFFPLAAPATLVMLIPGLSQNLLTDYGPQFENSYQYDAILIPFLLYGVTAGWRAIARRAPRQQRLLRYAALGTSLAAFLWWSPAGLKMYPWAQFRPDERAVALATIRDALPANAAVAASSNLVPHLTHRGEIWMVSTEPIAAPDIIVADLWDNTGFDSPEEFQQYLDRYTQELGYAAQLAEERYLILTRPAPKANLPSHDATK
ncbi:MAG: DUF2079 domain-containing protein [Patescibacteria group bacterium]|nr:DUF2079 domain-containing protein [Patescibacteria group bacterium]